MRTARLLLLALVPALTGGAKIAAQAVERSDVPGRGMLRVTFDPRIVGWDAQFVNGARLPLGLPLTGDTVGAAAIPVVARLEQDVRVASGVPGFIANLGRSLLSVRQERRTTPITAELGLSDRLSVSLSVPLVRVATRARLQISGTGANLGLNPLLQGVANSGALYGAFFAQFDTSLAHLDASIAGGGGADYAAAVVGLLRLPTAQREYDDDWLRQSLGDHQTDVEGRLVQELSLGNLWLNVAVRGGIQRPGTRVRRVAPFGAILVPFAATTRLAWDPGDYAGVDVAPLYRFSPRFAAGLTASYWIKQADRYTFRSAQDSLDLAARLGAPTSAALLDEGTAERRLRFGVAVTYVGPSLEGGFSIEQTVSGGTAGVTPAAPVYRIVLRTSRRRF